MNRTHADKDHMGSNKIEASSEPELSKAKMRASSVFPQWANHRANPNPP